MILTSRLAVFASVETLVNKALSYDPQTLSRFDDIDDSVVKIETTQPGVTLWIHFVNRQVKLLGTWEENTDASIKGKMSDFITLMKEEDKNQVLMSTKMEVVGNTQVLTIMQQIAANVDIDWEAAISDIVGDVPGHIMSNMAKHSLGFAREIHKSFLHSWDNYWQHESDSIVKPGQYSEVASDISALRFATDRLEARIQRIRTAKSGTN